MGLHKFLMKHGLGSPGYIAVALCRSYLQARHRYPNAQERIVLRSIFFEHVAAQNTLGGPAQYKLLDRNPTAIDKLMDQNPDLYSIILVAVFVLHPELVGQFARSDSLRVVNETVREVLDSKVPGWRSQGVWGNTGIHCYLCKEPIVNPDPSKMQAAINEYGHPEYSCDQCSSPLSLRAMSALGFFMGEEFR